MIYGHFYSRMDLNGEQLDSFWYTSNFELSTWDPTLLIQKKKGKFNKNIF